MRLNVVGALLFSVVVSPVIAADVPVKTVRPVSQVKLEARNFGRPASHNSTARNIGIWSHGGPGWNRGWRASDSLLPGYSVPYYGDYLGGYYGKHDLPDNLEVYVTTKPYKGCRSIERAYSQLACRQ